MMSSIQDQPVTETEEELPALSPEQWPDIEHLVTEDDTPVDNFFSAKNQRLLVEPLYSSWSGPPETGKFLVDANVGVFYSIYEPALVPDAFLSLDVEAPDAWWEKRHRSYFIWTFGKPPDVAIEIVSNRKGREADYKRRMYARMHIPYYVIFDPGGHLGDTILQMFELRGNKYAPLDTDTGWLTDAGLALRVWQGQFEGKAATWLRWCAQDGTLIPTGAERSERAEQQAAQERTAREHAEQRASQAEQQTAQERTVREQAEQRASQAEQQATEERRQRERLAARLRELGIDPEER
jgi:Uma2 family endonuclease